MNKRKIEALTCVTIVNEKLPRRRCRKNNNFAINQSQTLQAVDRRRSSQIYLFYCCCLIAKNTLLV